MKRTNEGLECLCGWFAWADLVWRIEATGEETQDFVFTCPICGTDLRREPFSYPSDAPR